MYSASKYAARAVTESIIAECMGTGVRVSSISPGPVNTNIWAHKTTPVTEERKEKMLRTEDIANIISFLLQSDSNVHIGNITVEPWFYLKSGE
jgi:NADP-dependent 3-hydroxy acid dehydrogenase YdfG